MPQESPLVLLCWWEETGKKPKSGRDDGEPC